MGVYLPGENFATQGPAPDGFHVPLSSEWVSLVGICTTLGLTLNGDTAKSYLKMPCVGYRKNTSSVSSQGSNGYYWTSSNIGNNAYYTNVSTAFTPNLGARRSYGSAIRCFKNVKSVPNANWTTLYDGSGVAAGAGIFHNSSLGLISLSGDGNTWITIMDKNLGATTVYNNGDTLSEANCGKYYQWGNNYGFPRTGSVTTSSTQVDASNYGPGNYYNSSTFITISSSPYDRSSIQNNNLWGGVDGNVPTMSDLKNAYIGEYGWHPGANTVMYYPFTTDQLDKVGSSSLSGTGTQETLGYTFNANEYIYVNNPSTSCRFISVWVKFNSSLGSYSQSPSTYVGQILYNFQHTSSSYNKRFQIEKSYNQWALSSAQNTSSGVWYHLAMGYDGSKVYAYINGVNVWEATSSSYNHGQMVLGRYINETISEFIGESVCWTAQEVSDYYNQTKANYGL